MSKIDFVSGEPSLLELFRALRSSRRSLKERFFYLVGLRPQNLAKILFKIVFSPLHGEIFQIIQIIQIFFIYSVRFVRFGRFLPPSGALFFIIF